MELTVASVLALPPLDGAGARVLSAPDRLDREVRWVHASELPDIAQFLSGGELLLTAGLGMGTTEHSQRTYIRDVAHAGAAALVIEESGRAFDAVPAVAVAEAAALDLPIVALATEVPFAQVSAAVHELLTQARVDQLTRERAIEESFSALLLDGADYLTIVRELSRHTGTSVVLENLLHHVVAYVGKTADDNHTVDNWDQHARSLHRDDDCFRRPVVMRGQPWGWLHLLRSDDREAGALDHFAVERAATTIAISLLTDRTREATDDQRSTTLITRLMLGDITGTDFARRAREIGYRLDSGSLTVMVVNTAPGDDKISVPFISADLGDYILAVVPDVATTGSDAATLLKSAAGGAGLSRSTTAEHLTAAVTQAQSAAAVARSLTHRPVLRFDDLGVERVLVSLADGPELANYVNDELGPILAWDASVTNPLMPTLRAYLDCDGRKSDAAAALYIQRRTLYNRLERISSLLHRSLDEPATRQRLLLAVKGLDLLDNTPRATTPRTR
ncbi:PucR family transcriptional regulator [Rhodococcus sp. UNC23MFCrub1.1]|uniref:PucR family transcriptional regulator n=1 Tax=Rhodococcus sp. UNC23MFCrub1.1 TaxID=1449068 RepID=UPI000482B283|nr:PucR family transcriptional regulator [Rhodococcus sp. UNC23MFCrub1.1]